MSQHELKGRQEHEVLWHQRRTFLQAAAAWAGAGGFAAAHAQQRSNIIELRGDALLNGTRMVPGQTIQTGDNIQTGPGTHLVFVIGNSSFLVRQNSRMVVERGQSLFTVGLLRLITGAVASVWGPGSARGIVTPTLTAGIRGTGVYTEVFSNQNQRSYFCNCYGTVDMGAAEDRITSKSSYHQAFWGEPAPVNGRSLTPAKAINHTDEELEYLARLVGQKTAWQAAGRKGVKDGMGYMDASPANKHPATP